MRARIFSTALLIIPVTLFAQRGGGGGGGGTSKPAHGFSGGDTKPDVKPITPDDINETNPDHLFVDKRKDLKLTDAQLGTLKDAESKLRDSTTSLFRAIDSLNFVVKLASKAPDDDDAQARIRVARLSFVRILGDIQDRFGAAGKDALALLDADQQKTANDLLEKVRAEFDKKVKERLSMR
jgi:hypothetical protein